VKKNSGQKSTLTERDCHILRSIVSKSHRTTAARVTAELNIHHEDPFSTETVQRELHRSNIHGRAATAKPLITENNAQMRKRWHHDHKTWISDK
jgi:FixJ family two-component response regulator